MGMTLSFLEKKKFPRSRKNYNSLAPLRVRAQMKIQQMAFMIMAVFFFFVLVGLFFLGIQFRGVGEMAIPGKTNPAPWLCPIFRDTYP